MLCPVEPMFNLEEGEELNMTPSLEAAPMNSPQELAAQISSVLAHWQATGAAGHWREPLVSVADAHDPLFQTLKEVVDPCHALPHDLLPGARSVIVFFLPFRKEVGKENADAGHFASRRWAQAYVDTNLVIGRICEHLKQAFARAGFSAAVTPATHNFDEKKLVSLWSHKHLGYIAGLGTFGHHHQLITRAGCAGRLGSIVTNAPLAADSRPPTEWCLFKRGEKCLACVAKCRYGALGKSRFDRHRCYAQLLANDARFDDLPLVDVCGKCACEVPCSHGIP